METGKVYLVGAGPGAEDLITWRGRELLKSCQAVVYDHLACESLLRLVPPDAKQIYVGKQAGHHAMKQEQINELLISLAEEGRMVVRLKGGDPFVFGRGGEEILALKEKQIPWEKTEFLISVIFSAGIFLHFCYFLIIFIICHNSSFLSVCFNKLYHNQRQL